jgi:hypothetical protein
VTCDDDKAERRRLRDLHTYHRSLESYDPDREEREKRIERYAAIVAAGGRLFEPTPAVRAAA